MSDTNPTKYENIPVFRMGGSLSKIDDIIGKALVEVSPDGEKTLITMEVGKAFTDFINMGQLRSLTLSSFIDKVDPEKAREWWESRQR